ncbi:MAG: oligosaccharide flippase family protein [Roseibium sp.]
MASMLRMSVVNTSAGMLSMLAGFICSIIVARVLGVEGTGLVAYALWFMTVATIVSDNGMPQAALRFIKRDVTEKLLYSVLFQKLFRRFVVTTSLMAVGILGYSLWLASQGNSSGSYVWLVTVFLFLSYAYSTMGIAAAQGLGQFDRAAQMTFIGCLVQPFCVLAGALILGPAGAIIGHAIRHLPQALDLRRYVKCVPADNQPISADIRRYARNNWFSGSVLALFGARIELAIIGFFFSISQVGYYSIGLTMTGMVAQLSLFIVAFVVPQFGALHDQADDVAFADAFEKTIRWLSIIIAPIAIGGAAIAPELIPLVFGSDFEPAVMPAIILLVFSITHALASVISRAILAKNRSADELRMTLVWCGITIVTLLLIVPSYGQIGAAWVRAGANVLLFTILGVYCIRVLKLRFPFFALIKCILAASLCAAAATYVLSAISGTIGLLLAVSVAAPVYLSALLLFQTVPKSEIAPMIEEIRSRLKPDKPA